MRTYVHPENEATKTTLVKYMEQILFGLHDFLGEHVGITEEASLKELSLRYTHTLINDRPEKKLADVITDLIEDIAPHAVNVASPYFVGHMTAAIPFFMVHLKTITAALNQNTVKLETSKVVSIIEKQVLAKIHRLIFNRSQAFYDTHVQHVETTLGSFVEDGTLANITALWVARNRLLASDQHLSGVEKEGLQSAMTDRGIKRCVVLVSRLGHYSIKKAGGLLGIGNRNIIPVEVDANYRIDLNTLQRTLDKLGKSINATRIVAVVGIAGTTETGSVDPLASLAAICRERGIHFHVDAAWGGPTIMSDRYRHLLDGISLADSACMDGHKQLYMPMSSGMVFFRDPLAMDAIAYHANYINRPGSVDLGIKSLPGSREASSLILDSALKIMGTKGYALLIDHGIDTARRFAREIKKRPLFELVTKPELNILTYRINPGTHRQGTFDKQQLKTLNDLNIKIQRLQREAGKSFVSRTTLFPTTAQESGMVVLRCVIMNPLTTIDTLREILDDQESLYHKMRQ
jgi:glutamate decarboxylase